MRNTKSPIDKSHGKAEWTPLPGDRYVATGVDMHGRRLASVASDNWHRIMGVNLYKGNKWLVRNGKRYHIQRVEN